MKLGTLALATTILAACTSDARDSGRASPPDAPDTPPPAPTAPTPTPACPTGTRFTASDGKILVEVTLNGAGPFRLLLDTGAPYSLVDPSVVAKAGAPPYVVGVGGASVKVDDLASGTLGGGILGVIGADVFGKRALTVDYARSRVWLEDALDARALLACSHLEGAPAESPLVASDYVFVSGSIEGIAGSFIVDTGATRAVVSDGVFAKLDAAHARPSLDGFLVGSGAGDFWARITSLARVEIAGKHVDHIFALTADDAWFAEQPPAGGTLLGLLPYEFLRHFLVSFDFPRKKLRLDAVKGDPMREASTYFPFGIGIERTKSAPVHVAQVLAGSAAASADVMLGDVVAAVDDADFGVLGPYGRLTALTAQAPATSHTLTLTRGDPPTTVTVTVTSADLLSDP